MTFSDEEIRALLRVVLATDPVEIDCDEILARIAAFLEARGPKGSLPAELALVSQHLAVCAECREEFDALLRTRRG